MYGGRTIDSFDRRVLKTYMDEYFGDFLFDEYQAFHFYHDDQIDYMIPAEPDGITDYRDNFLSKHVISHTSYFELYQVVNRKSSSLLFQSLFNNSSSYHCQWPHKCLTLNNPLQGIARMVEKTYGLMSSRLLVEKKGSYRHFPIPW